MEVLSSVSRLVAFFVAPLIAVVVPIIVNWAQDEVGMDLNGSDLTILLTAVVVSTLGVVFKWLDGRAKFEVAEVVDQRRAPIEVEPEPMDEPETLKSAS